jgi:tyrosine-protein phosphatase SIW14
MRLWHATALISLITLQTITVPLPIFSLSGVPNFHRVNDALYRGGQPSIEGLHALANLGIKTVLDLRLSTRVSDWEEREVKRFVMRYVHLRLYGKETPSPKDINKAFSVINDPAECPVFIHCREGKDRTGMIVGCYRVAHDHWSNRRALAEATSYAGRELHKAMEQYILQFTPAANSPMAGT